MPKKKKYNNPYYLELLKALVARKATKGARNTIAIEDLRCLSDNLFRSEYLLKVMPVNGVTKSTAYSLKDYHLNVLFSYIKDHFRIYEECTTYNDFIVAEHCNFAEQFDDSKHFFNYPNTLKTEVCQKVEERVNEILGRSNTNKKNNSYSETELVFELFDDIIQCEDLINFSEKKLSTNTKTHADLKRTIDREKSKQTILIDKLENLIKAKPDVVTPSFVRILSQHFKYDWYNLLSLKLCHNILPIAKIAIETRWDEGSANAINLKINLFKITWALGKNDYSKEVFLHTDNQLDRLSSVGKIGILEFQNKKRVLLDYGCGFMLNLTEKYRDLADTWMGNKDEKLNMLATTRKCSACRFVRENQLQEAEKWLGEAHDYIQKISRDTNMDVSEKSAYFHFIESGLYLKKGEEYYELAYKSAEKSLECMEEGRFEIASIEVAFVYYILFKTGNYIQKESEAKGYGRLAYKILKSGSRKNYCLFDYWEVCHDLERNLMNLIV